MKIQFTALRKKSSSWLIAIGLFIILGTLAGTAYTYYQQQKLYDEYLANQKKLEQSYTQAGSILAQGTSDSALDTTSSAAASAPVLPSDIQVLGKIKIPSIGVDLLLVDGVTAKDLRIGAGHFPESALPGQTGNCAVAGHRNYTFGSMFNRLDEVKRGDIITIESSGHSYRYEVTDSFVVVPEDVSVLRQNSKKSELTLVTCTPVRVATHRLIIRAELIP